jgi:hypothetical protein
MDIRFMIAVLIFLWLLTPEVICLLPGVEMMDEHECCREMAGQCSNIPMPDSHTCCQNVRASMGVVVSKAHDYPDLRIATLAEISDSHRAIIVLQAQNPRFQPYGVSPPALLSAHSIDILRI